MRDDGFGRIYDSVNDLPDQMKKLHRKGTEVIRKEREERDDTPEGEDRSWGPKKLKQIIKRQRRHDDDR